MVKLFDQLGLFFLVLLYLDNPKHRSVVIDFDTSYKPLLQLNMNREYAGHQFLFQFVFSQFLTCFLVGEKA